VAGQKDNSMAHQVLFVDDEPDLLQLFKETFGQLSAGQWAIHCAKSAAEALEMLKQRRMDLVVVDTNMPLLDGVQFLGLVAKRYPDLKKVSLSAFVTEENRTACLTAGAELFIEKPRSQEGFKSVFAMLDDLMNWAPQQGFQGVLRRVGLQDVIQMECLGRNSSVLEVYNDSVLGRIYIENGNIIHAAGGELTGEPALQKLLALPGGSFELVPFEPPPNPTISGPWEFLLMEAARVRDELASQAPPLPPPPEEPKVEEPVAATPEGGAAMGIAETLICSDNGETLYEAGCGNVPARIQFLGEIGLLATQLKNILPLGQFDRVELHFPEGRAVAQVKPDRIIFVAAANHLPDA
jgi:CheY-like chemotaxis protein